MLSADGKREALREQGPSIEPIPAFAKRTGNRDLRLALLEPVDDLLTGAAQEAQLEPLESPHELSEIGHEQSDVHGRRDRD